MLIECATVTAVDGDRVMVRRARPAGCARCAAGQGCGGGLVAWLIERGSQDLQLTPDTGRQWVPGQQVQLQIARSEFLRATAALYLLPLLGLLGGAMLGYAAASADAGTAVGALAGLLVAGLAMRFVVARTLMPRIKLFPNESAPS